MSRAALDRRAENVLLVVVGLATLGVLVNGSYVAYVKAGFAPLLLLGGVVTLALGLTGLLWPGGRPAPTPARRRTTKPSAALRTATAARVTDDVRGDDHGHGSPRSAWLMVLPVAVLLLVSPAALGSFTASRQAQAIGAPTGAEASSPIGPDDPGADYRSESLLVYGVRALAEDTSALTGRTFRLEGFVVPRDGGGYYLTRMAITCCAADARPVAVLLDGVTTDLVADEWIEVIGSWAPPQQHPGGGWFDPAITPRSVTPAETPQNTYEYPNAADFIGSVDYGSGG